MAGRIKRSDYVAFWIAGGVFAAFLAVGLLYILVVREHNREESLRYLNDAVSQRQAALSQQFSSDLQMLRGVAVSIAEMDVNDREHIYNILNTINRSNAFIRMGFADNRGIAALVDLDGSIYRDVDVSARGFFLAARGGEEVISGTFFEDLTDEYVNYYAVPVRKHDNVVGVLLAVNADDVLHNIVAVPVFNGAGHYFVIDDRGVTVVPTVAPEPIAGLGSDIFQIMDFPPPEREAFAHALASTTGGDFEFSSMGKRQFGVLHPIGVNDWFVLGVVPRSAIGAYYNRTSIGVTFLVMAAALILLFHFYWQFRVVIRNQRELKRLAYTDQLTGDRNLPKFTIDAERILRERGSRQYAFWSFDVKYFGRINELYGNEIGDTVLLRVANILREHMPDGIFCRDTADQFVGLMPYAKREELRCWAEGIFKAMADNEAIEKSRLRLDGAIGIYCVDDFDDEPTVDNMVNRAAVAKKIAKRFAGSGALFFTQEMSNEIRREARLEATSREALSAGHISFHLQPKVEIQRGCRIAGAEALARWSDPEFGGISPGDFIPLFERNGFIVTLDREIFGQVCGWYRAWLAAGNIPVKVSINVSRQGLLRDDFIAYYVFIKEGHAIPDGHLELEFTESVIQSDYQLFCRTVKELQRAGFACSIDDFGSGYSSLNVLKNLPIDVLKLDALFFQGEDNLGRARTVVEDFIGLARKLEIRTVAEGVEDLTQVDFLRGAGCDLVQGYFFSRPVPPAEFELFDIEIGPDLVITRGKSETNY